MNTKLKGDIAEQAAILQALKRGWGVLNPVGDRLPYDLVLDVEGKLVRVQVKSAWFDGVRLYIEDLDLFYVFPIEVFISYASEIHMVEADKRQRKPRSARFRDDWDLILHWAARGETHV